MSAAFQPPGCVTTWLTTWTDLVPPVLPVVCGTAPPGSCAHAVVAKTLNAVRATETLRIKPSRVGWVGEAMTGRSAGANAPARPLRRQDVGGVEPGAFV